MNDGLLNTIMTVLSRLTEPVLARGNGVVADRFVSKPRGKIIAPVPSGRLSQLQGYLSPQEMYEPPPSPIPVPTPKPINPRYAEQVLPSGTPRELAIPMEEAATQYNISPEVLGRVFSKESIDYNPYYVYGPGKSPAGAMGIGQFMPIALQELSRLGYNEGEQIDPYNPDQAIPATAFFLNYLLNQTGNLRDTLSGYNAGLGNLEAGYNYADDIIRQLRGGD